VNGRGFSFVETLIYVGIVAIVAGLLTSILTVTVKIQNQQIGSYEVGSQLNITLNYIQRLIRASSNIEIQPGTAVTELKLRSADPQKDPTLITWNPTTKQIEVKEGAANPYPITTTKVNVDALTFTKLTSYPGHDVVQIDIRMSYNTDNPNFAFSKTLSSAIARVSAATFDDNVIPGASNTYDVGQSLKPWRHGYFSGNLTVDNGTLFVDSLNHRVGIGTLSPTTKLDANGSLQVYDRTPTTGVSTLTIRAGAGQSTNPLLQWQNNAGAGLGAISGNGGLSLGTLNPGSYQFYVSGTSFFGDNVTLNNKNITGLAAPIGATDAATKSYVDTALSSASGLPISVMYLENAGTAKNCPAGWTTASSQNVFRGGSTNADTSLTTCYRTDLACEAMYLETSVTTYPTCPSGWSQAATTEIKRGGSTTANEKLTICYKCQPKPPSVPLNLTAIAGDIVNIDYTAIKLTWQSPSDQGGSSLIGYNIYRGTQAGAETLINTINATYNYWGDTGTAGQTYYYQVSAVNNDGESPKTNEANAFVPPLSGGSATFAQINDLFYVSSPGDVIDFAKLSSNTFVEAYGQGGSILVRLGLINYSTSGVTVNLSGPIWAGSTASYNFLEIEPLTSTQFILLYAVPNYLGVHTGIAQIGTLSGSGSSATIVFSQGVQFSTDSGPRLTAAKLDASRFIVTYKNKIRIGTVSGAGTSATITFGQEYTIPNSSNETINAAASLDTSRFIISYESYNPLTKNYTHYSLVGTVSGATITFGQPVLDNSTLDGGYYATILILDASRFLITGDRKVYRIGTVSGNSISYGPYVNLDLYSPPLKSYVSLLDSSHFVVVTLAQSKATSIPNNYHVVIVGTISGNTISLSPQKYAYSNYVSGQLFGVVGIDATHFIATRWFPTVLTNFLGTVTY